jgi:glycosyltransferase involved in cell wall biosynthesis
MACGTPVLAMPGGSVPEIIRDGISGYVCRTVVEMAKHVSDLRLSAQVVRQYATENFSIEWMAKEYLRAYEDALLETKARRAA